MFNRLFTHSLLASRISLLLASHFLLLAFPTLSWSMPAQITYQGTLKEKGVPVTATKTMSFRLTNEGGTAVYWSSQSMSVDVHQGLFSVPLTINTPTFDWQTVSPFMEVSIDGQVLSPREPVTATLYALVSQTVEDYAITLSKLSAPVADRLIPAGMIAMFAATDPQKPCPDGWTRFAALDNRFPMGSDTYGALGGSSEHNHTISTDGAHNHGGTTSTANRNQFRNVSTPEGSINGEYLEDVANQYVERASNHSHAINSDGAHNHGGFTGLATSLPPYVKVVFCQKN